MSTLPLVTIPTSSLRERSRELEISEITTPEFQRFLDTLIETMFVEDGIGIAAPQVGKNIRAIIVNLKKEGATAFINPEITKASEATIVGEEGCLSVPEKYGNVRRHKRITLRALTRHGRKIEMDVSGLFATVFQHEIDHLDGILYIDRAIEVFDKTTSKQIRL
jgi:peptide deformylase